MDNGTQPTSEDMDDAEMQLSNVLAKPKCREAARDVAVILLDLKA